MGAWHKPASRGARKTLAAVRRAEAETRQAAERARDAERAAARIKPGTDEYEEPEPLTDAELGELLYAVMRQDALRAYKERSGALRGGGVR